MPKPEINVLSTVLYSLTNCAYENASEHAYFTSVREIKVIIKCVTLLVHFYSLSNTLDTTEIIVHLIRTKQLAKYRLKHNIFECFCRIVEIIYL